MSFDGTTVMTWLANHSLRVALLVIVVGAGSILARRASAHGRLFAWTVVLYTAAAMPLLAGLLPDVRVPIVFSEPVLVVPEHGGATIASFQPTPEGVPASQSSSGLPWLLALYCAGTGVLISRLVAGTHQTTRVLRRAQPVDDAAFVAELHALSSAMGLPRVPPVVQHASVHVPFVCGLCRPTVVLPEAWGAWDPAMLRAVLTHELSHIARRDLWTMRVASIYCAATWLNPLSWWLRRKLETLAERASDDDVLASGGEPTAYAEILVQFFEAAQRKPGRASWQLAMARRNGVEAQKRVGRVLDASEGGSVRLGTTGRVLVGVTVALAAVPVIALSVEDAGAVAIQQPAVVVKQVKVAVVEPTPVAVRHVSVIPHEQEPEPEPWRSTRKATDADVVAPILTRMLHPRYTPNAMRAKVQGTVVVEAIVSAEGEVSAVRVVKSLDREFGLDDEALKAASQWTFLPGTVQGQAVAVRVMLDLQFQLH
ncbi:MAG TPA: M56 family metallopeptidase [Vicinamibacterales bacterium]|nr:M56 family metallopeptidase [Vicinamibacterales bacterium]